MADLCVNGGVIDPDQAALAQVALAAELYNRPLFEYVDYLRRTRERYGEEAAQFDLDFALALREKRIQKANETNERLDRPAN